MKKAEQAGPGYDPQVAVMRWLPLATNAILTPGGSILTRDVRQRRNEMKMIKWIMTIAIALCTATLSSAQEAKCREIAQREYPSDRQMQEYVYKQQSAAARYMATVSDQDVKKIALREYPEDFSMQKYTYDQQSSAKRYMSTVSDSELKSISLREYPSDYTMQKYTYDQQYSAKQYMSSMPNDMAKQKARREYPNDYTMQKYTYDNMR